MRLLADIGGTNARFAMATEDGQLRSRQTLKVAAFPELEDAIAAYVADVPERPTSATICAAGPVINCRVEMTNANWTISRDAIRSVCPSIPVQIVNDLVAVALAVPVLGPEGFVVLHPGASADESAPMLSLNIGTGFGAALTVRQSGRWHALATEAGHMTLATIGREERELLGDGRTVEEVFSGPGLKSLRDRLGGTDPSFRELYSRVLGRLAGDLALGLGAWGGINFCGGVVDDFDNIFDKTALVGAVRNRRGLAQRLETVPVRRIVAADPAFLGLLQIDPSSDR